MEERPNISDLVEQSRENFELDFQKYFSRGIAICNKYLFGFVGFTLMYFVLLEVFGRLPLGIIINQLIISPILFGGIYFVSNKISEDQEYNFDDFWKGFRYWEGLVFINLIQSAAIIFFLLPFFNAIDVNEYLAWWEAIQNNPDSVESPPKTPTWILLLFIPIIYFMVSWCFAPMLVIFQKLTAWEAMKVSLKIVSQNWWRFAILYFMTTFLAGFGILIFGIGIIYTLPLSMCILYVAFEDMIQFYIREDKDEDDLMKHLIEKGF